MGKIDRKLCREVETPQRKPTAENSPSDTVSGAPAHTTSRLFNIKAHDIHCFFNLQLSRGY